MTLATAIAALLLWGGTGGRAYAQLQPQYLLGHDDVKNIYGAGESTRLTGAAGPVGIYASGEPNNVSGGANIVIHSYNAGGRWTDYTNVWTGTYPSCPGPDWSASSGISWILSRTDNSSGHSYPCNIPDTFTYRTGDTSPEIYTSTKDNTGKDDGILLVQTINNPVHDENSWNGVTPPRTSGNNLDDYKRPTTINVYGPTTLDFFRVGDLHWYYQTYTLKQEEKSDGCSHCITTPPPAHAAYDKISHKWHYWADPVPHRGLHNLDAALRLVRGAEVCVTGDVKDFTTDPASDNTAALNDETDAVVVLPNNGRYTLRVAGNIDKMNMAHDTTASADYYYTQANLPAGADSIFSYPSSAGHVFVDASGFNFAPPSLGAFNTGAVNLPALKTNTPASVIGVNGNYLFTSGNAEWTTHTPDKVADHPGVIEVGEKTKGTEHMHIFSGGMLKNFDGCGVDESFTMNLGGHNGDDKAPTFYIQGGQPLYIANFGVGKGGSVPIKPCQAKLNLYKEALNAISNAFSDPQDTGAVRIQALSDVNLCGKAEFLPKIDNELSILSDGGNVSIMGEFSARASSRSNGIGIFPYAENMHWGRGWVTIWAEDRTGGSYGDFSSCENRDLDNSGEHDRNSTRGNVYFNSAASNILTIGRNRLPGNLNSENSIGEMNIRAAHNIRTNKFSVRFGIENIDVGDSIGENATIYARKGDIYLGYGVGTPIYKNDGSSDYDYSSYNTTDKHEARSLKLILEDSTHLHGIVNIQAGWDDNVDRGRRMDGGNIYFARISTWRIIGEGLPNDDASRGHYAVNLNIPFSNEYICGQNYDGAQKEPLLHNRGEEAMVRYEHSGIIGGLGRCGWETQKGWDQYAGKLADAPSYSTLIEKGVFPLIRQTFLFRPSNGDLTLDAGKRGNIIINTGANFTSLNARKGLHTKGNIIFRTREGDIDLRSPFVIDTLKGNMLFLAQLEKLEDLAKIPVCGCREERNNVYLQDFRYTAGTGGGGSVFIGADNNIKLNYGGLANQGTRNDPFLSAPYKEDANGRPLRVGAGYQLVHHPNSDLTWAFDQGICGGKYHCDLNPEENQAKDFILDFNGGANPIPSGGFAAVASDMIDVYKKFIYKGGNGSGMGAVPGTGTLHGENVTGYGLFMKAQGNKANWTTNILTEVPECPIPCTPTDCDSEGRGFAFLHNTVRMTFHSDALIQAENQRVHLEAPVIETFGVLKLDTKTKAGPNGSITFKADSLICHDKMIVLGDNVHISTWSGLPNDLPIIKLGYNRNTPPVMEYAYEDENGKIVECNKCVNHYKGKVYGPDEIPMDTTLVLFGPHTNDLWRFKRQPTLVVDHTILTFGSDSFDHVKGGDILDARFLVDTLKFRHQVELFTDKKHEREGHLELISERQTGSKDYAGLYTRHLHTEPIGACGNPTSELWIHDPAIDVTTSTTLGGFGIIYSDVHVENGGHLNAGFTSLRMHGQCYEQQAGTLTTKDLRLDAGAQLHFSVGTTLGLNGEYSDAVDVDRLTTYGSVDINIEIRPCEKMEKRCYPIIYYKSVSPNSLNNLKLTPRSVMIDGEEVPLNLVVSYTGVVYVCIGENVTPAPVHTVTMPETPGVTTTPGKGIWPVTANSAFRFKAVYSTPRPLVVRTNRKNREQKKTGDKPTQKISPVPTPKEEPYEVLAGVKNTNGEYEYLISNVQEEITLTFGPDYVSNELLAGTAVWSHGEMIYIRVTRADIASIYSVAGQLVRKIDLPEGDTSIPMSRGAYVITLKDGSVHKVFVK